MFIYTSSQTQHPPVRPRPDRGRRHEQISPNPRRLAERPHLQGRREPARIRRDPYHVGKDERLGVCLCVLRVAESTSHGQYLTRSVADRLGPLGRTT